jgi:hypothetical protein
VKLFRSTGVFAILLFFGSCDFQPDGVKVTSIMSPSTGDIVINLNGYPDQQIFLKGVTQFNYSISAEDRELTSIEVTVDDQPIGVSYSGNLAGTFQLSPTDYTVGQHKLKITYLAKSGTGSLVDTYDGERLVVWIERDIVITATPGSNEAVKISSVANVDGTIQITWTKSKSTDFVSYQLNRVDYDKAGYVIGTFTFPAITDAGVTSMNDQTYLPGKSQYQLTITTRSVDYATNSVIYEYSYDPSFSSMIAADGTVTLTWKSLYPLRLNFHSYNLLVKETSNFNHENSFEHSEVLDTTVIFKPDGWGLGSIRPLKFTLNRESTSIETPPVYNSSLLYGDKFPLLYSFSDIYPTYHQDRKQYYLFYFSHLRRATEEGQLVDSTTQDYSLIRMANNFAIATTEAGVYKKINLETLEESSLTLPLPYLITLTNNGTLAVSDGTNTAIYSPKGVKLKEMIYSSYGGLSPDGNYLFTSGTMNKFNGTEYVSTFPFSESEGYKRKSMTFVPETNPTHVVFGFTNKITTLSLTSGAYETVSTDITGPCNYDPFSNKLGCYSGNTYVILNAEDNSIFKSVPIIPELQQGSEYFYLLNSAILCPGVILQLSDIH